VAMAAEEMLVLRAVKTEAAAAVETGALLAAAETVTVDETGAVVASAVTVAMMATGGRQQQKQWGQVTII